MTASRIVIAAFAGLCSVAAFGQIPPPATPPVDPNNPAAQGQTTNPGTNVNKGPRDASQNSGSQNKQLGGDKTGNNDDSNNNNNVKPAAGDKSKNQIAGPDIIDDSDATPEQKASAEYSGPAILSRGISASEPLNPKNIKFTPSVGLEYLVNSGLTGLKIENGKFSNNYSQGLQLSYGLIGEKVFRRDVLSLAFAGNLYHYTQAGSLDGTDNQLKFTWRHRLARHISFGINESFQEYNRNNLLLSGSQLITSGGGSTLVTATPATEAFDGRVISVFNEANMTWQLSARTSINFAGGGFFTRRASTSLYGDTGYQAGADVAYRITRKVTAGVYYSYTHFDYTGIYGGSDINTVGLTYSIAFNSRTELSTRVGGSRLETTGLQTVALDPFLAVLFGTSGTIEAVYMKNFVPDFNVQMRRKVANLDLALAYVRGVTPGNGVILTSIRQGVSLGAHYVLKRHWNIAPSVGWDTLGGVGADAQKYSDVYAGASVYRKIMRNLDWHVRTDFRHYTFDNTQFLRNSFVFSTGIVWSPADMLDRLW